jgi:hypothetical protein
MRIPEDLPGCRNLGKLDDLFHFAVIFFTEAHNLLSVREATSTRPAISFSLIDQAIIDHPFPRP